VTRQNCGNFEAKFGGKIEEKVATKGSLLGPEKRKRKEIQGKNF